MNAKVQTRNEKIPTVIRLKENSPSYNLGKWDCG